MYLLNLFSFLKKKISSPANLNKYNCLRYILAVSKTPKQVTFIFVFVLIEMFPTSYYIHLLSNTIASSSVHFSNTSFTITFVFVI